MRRVGISTALAAAMEAVGTLAVDLDRRRRGNAELDLARETSESGLEIVG